MDETTRLHCMSYGLYRAVEDIVGTQREVEIRRSVTNLKNDYYDVKVRLSPGQLFGDVSGSYAEGFRFASSDKDYMFVHRNITVIDNVFPNYDSRDTFFLMETNHTRPGFALLKLISESRLVVVSRSCVQYLQGLYLSSSLWKNTMPKAIPNSTPHGPCESGMICESELDFAHCLKCNSWPRLANGCIVRLRRAGWPSAAVLGSIIAKGCHFVAIGGRESIHENIEWRISFSFAEKTLIHQMNHCQFLCYGLMKIFLKEVIEKDTENKVLCSYFLKTAVLWEICENRAISWNSSNLFICFWSCFKRLINWVIHEFCPNFFIPENNMFYGKIHGFVRTELLNRLISLYNEGFNCLLRCASLQPAVGLVVERPLEAMLLPLEEDIYTKSYHDRVMVSEMIIQMPPPFWDANTSWMSLCLTRDCGNEIKRVTLYIWKKIVMQYCFVHSISCEASRLPTTNKGLLKHKRMVLRTFRALAFDLVQHRLLSAIYMYRNGHYNDAVKVLLHTKSKVQKEKTMYCWNIDLPKYQAAGGDDVPCDDMMRRTLVYIIVLPMSFCVPELTMEHQATDAHLQLCNGLDFPTLALINFLLYLCYDHMRQPNEADAMLQELTVLVKYDDGHHIHHMHKALSLTMLGISQEMSEDYGGAHQSYNEALNDQFNVFKEATRVRIDNVLAKMNTT